MTDKDTARLLRRLADTIDRSSPSDLELLLQGKATLAISSEGTRDRKRAVKRGSNGHGQNALETVADSLRRMESRDAVNSELMAKKWGKEDLEELARFLDLPVLREDNAERLRQKIVEETIGARLNSQAIRGEQSL